MKKYEDFKLAVAVRESSRNYAAKNQFGFLGAYQMGMPRLADIGLTYPLKTGSMSNKDYSWRPGFSEQLYLSSPTIQDAVFDIHVQLLKQSLLKRGFVDGTYFGNWISMSGAIGCAHLLGIGGLVNLWQYGKNGTDANNTTGLSYVKLFNDYEIP